MNARHLSIYSSTMFCFVFNVQVFKIKKKFCRTMFLQKRSFAHQKVMSTQQTTQELDRLNVLSWREREERRMIQKRKWFKRKKIIQGWKKRKERNSSRLKTKRDSGLKFCEFFFVFSLYFFHHDRKMKSMIVIVS